MRLQLKYDSWVSVLRSSLFLPARAYFWKTSHYCFMHAFTSQLVLQAVFFSLEALIERITSETFRDSDSAPGDTSFSQTAQLAACPWISALCELCTIQTRLNSTGLWIQMRMIKEKERFSNLGVPKVKVAIHIEIC
ncbi:hypothetical protein XELAEV_18033620mg [Xenopus laevis]|uniref:Uncharacterized protein n=1 Tax=Xenopus laevis TaxID=8355 RepID=A0A974CJU4_XENLA|nr:hypothetical protein XELAEV_18033620mg [Xenopus laevis]